MEPRTEVGSLRQADQIVGFEPETFRLGHITLNFHTSFH